MVVPFFIGPTQTTPLPATPPRPIAGRRQGPLWDGAGIRVLPRAALTSGDPPMAFTFFFRDEQTLEALIDQAMPALQGQAFIRIWDAGCAHGPEPYTLAILLRERMSDFIFRNVHIHASDVDPQFGPRIAEGVFGEREVQRIPEAIRARYFHPASEPGYVEVVEELRRKVVFTHHDLLSLKPLREDFSLIVCKNVLLHFSEAQRLDVLRMFHRALRPGGLLAAEHTQKMPEQLRSHFHPVSPFAQVYRCLDGPHTHRGACGPHALHMQPLRGR